MNPKGRKCGNCLYYLAVNAGEGFCRRHAPTPLLVPVGAENIASEVQWPQMEALDWCGEWQPLPVSQVENQ